MAETDAMTLRQIAGEAGMSLGQAREALEDEGIPAPHPRRRISGRRLRQVRRALGLAPRPGEDPKERLTLGEIDARILLPLLRKGKVGRTRTTPIENAWGRGIPDDQKAEAKERVEELLREDVLREKPSQGRRHVYLSPKGRERAKAIREEQRREAER